ncbi:hypothetical protein ACFQH6_11095 [Halobacteriaceae archaeon GCM10025711]
MAHVLQRAYFQRTVLVVVASTVSLTASFIGMIALATGQAGQVGARLPFYVLAMAVAFVVAVFLLDERGHDGVTVILGSIGIAIVSFVLVSLGAEGVVFTVRHPEQVLTGRLILYFLAAGLIASGLGYWGLRFWRDFAVSDDEPDDEPTEPTTDAVDPLADGPGDM